MLEQTTVKGTTPHHMVVWMVNSNSTGGMADYDAHGLLFLGMLVQGNRHNVCKFS